MSAKKPGLGDDIDASSSSNASQQSHESLPEVASEITGEGMVVQDSSTGEANQETAEHADESDGSAGEDEGDKDSEHDEQPARPSSRLDLSFDDEGMPITPQESEYSTSRQRLAKSPALSGISEGSSHGRDQHTFQGTGEGIGMQPVTGLGFRNPGRNDSEADSMQHDNTFDDIADARSRLFEGILERIRSARLFTDPLALMEAEAIAATPGQQAARWWDTIALQEHFMTHIEDFSQATQKRRDDGTVFPAEVQTEVTEQLQGLASILRQTTVRWLWQGLRADTDCIQNVLDGIVRNWKDRPTLPPSSRAASTGSNVSRPERVLLPHDPESLRKLGQNELIALIIKQNDDRRTELDEYEAEIDRLQRDKDEAIASWDETEVTLQKLTAVTERLRQEAYGNALNGKDIDGKPLKESRTRTGHNNRADGEPEDKETWIDRLENDLAISNEKCEKYEENIKHLQLEIVDLNANLATSREAARKERAQAYGYGRGGLNPDGTEKVEPMSGQERPVGSIISQATGRRKSSSDNESSTGGASELGDLLESFLDYEYEIADLIAIDDQQEQQQPGQIEPDRTSESTSALPSPQRSQSGPTERPISPTEASEEAKLEYQIENLTVANRQLRKRVHTLEQMKEGTSARTRAMEDVRNGLEKRLQLKTDETDVAQRQLADLKRQLKEFQGHKSVDGSTPVVGDDREQVVGLVERLLRVINGLRQLAPQADETAKFATVMIQAGRKDPATLQADLQLVKDSAADVVWPEADFEIAPEQRGDIGQLTAAVDAWLPTVDLAIRNAVTLSVAVGSLRLAVDIWNTIDSPKRGDLQAGLPASLSSGARAARSISAKERGELLNIAALVADEYASGQRTTEPIDDATKLSAAGAAADLFMRRYMGEQLEQDDDNNEDSVGELPCSAKEIIIISDDEDDGGADPGPRSSGPTNTVGPHTAESRSSRSPGTRSVAFSDGNDSADGQDASSGSTTKRSPRGILKKPRLPVATLEVDKSDVSSSPSSLTAFIAPAIAQDQPFKRANALPDIPQPETGRLLSDSLLDFKGPSLESFGDTNNAEQPTASDIDEIESEYEDGVDLTYAVNVSGESTKLTETYSNSAKAGSPPDSRQADAGSSRSSQGRRTVTGSPESSRHGSRHGSRHDSRQKSPGAQSWSKPWSKSSQGSRRSSARTENPTEQSGKAWSETKESEEQQYYDPDSEYVELEDEGPDISNPQDDADDDQSRGPVWTRRRRNDNSDARRPTPNPWRQLWDFIWFFIRFFTFGQLTNIAAIFCFLHDLALFHLEDAVHFLALAPRWWQQRRLRTPRLPRANLLSFLLWLLLMWQMTMMVALGEERRLWLAANPRTAAYMRGLPLRDAYGPRWSPFPVDYALLEPALGGFRGLIHRLYFPRAVLGSVMEGARQLLLLPLQRQLQKIGSYATVEEVVVHAKDVVVHAAAALLTFPAGIWAAAWSLVVSTVTHWRWPGVRPSMQAGGTAIPANPVTPVIPVHSPNPQVVPAWWEVWWEFFLDLLVRTVTGKTKAMRN